ncbi:hypothetical protein F4861DRAFT_544553, partial [Xylaria intraflava]
MFQASSQDTAPEIINSQETHHTPSDEGLEPIRNNMSTQEEATAATVGAAKPARLTDQLHLLMAPDVNTHPHLAFDGTNVTSWLEMVENAFQRRRIDDETRINHLPFYATDQDRIRTITMHLKGIKTWADAKAKLKKEYRFKDARQQMTASDLLRDYEDAPHSFSVAGMKDYIDKHKLLSQDVRESAELNDKPFSERDLTSGLLRPFSSAILNKLMMATRNTLDELKAMDYDKLQSHINVLLSNEGDLETHDLKLDPARLKAVRQLQAAGRNESGPVSEDRDRALPLVIHPSKGNINIDGKPMTLAKRESPQPTTDSRVDEITDKLEKMIINLTKAQNMTSQEKREIDNTYYPAPQNSYTQGGYWGHPPQMHYTQPAEMYDYWGQPIPHIAAMRGGFGGNYGGRGRGGGRGGANVGRGPSGARCFACLQDTHYQMRCPLAEEMYRNGIMQLENGRWYLGGKHSPQNITCIEVPSHITADGRQSEGVVIKTLRWIWEYCPGTDRNLQYLAYYELTKRNLMPRNDTYEKNRGMPGRSATTIEQEPSESVRKGPSSTASAGCVEVVTRPTPSRLIDVASQDWVDPDQLNDFVWTMQKDEDGVECLFGYMPEDPQFPRIDVMSVEKRKRMMPKGKNVADKRPRFDRPRMQGPRVEEMEMDDTDEFTPLGPDFRPPVTNIEVQVPTTKPAAASEGTSRTGKEDGIAERFVDDKADGPTFQIEVEQALWKRAEAIMDQKTNVTVRELCNLNPELGNMLIQLAMQAVKKGPNRAEPTIRIAPGDVPHFKESRAAEPIVVGDVSTVVAINQGLSGMSISEEENNIAEVAVFTMEGGDPQITGGLLGGSGFVVDNYQGPEIGAFPAFEREEVKRVIEVMSAPVLA